VTTYIIDGYNLLHRSFPELLVGDDLRTARESIEARVRSFQRARAATVQVELVWDGDAEARERRLGRGAFRVVFSRSPQSADDVILERCRELSGTRDVCVVTSDVRDIVVPTRALRVRHMTSEEFARDLDGSPKRAPGAGIQTTSSDKPTRSSPREVDGWLHEFDLHPGED